MRPYGDSAAIDFKLRTLYIQAVTDTHFLYSLLFQMNRFRGMILKRSLFLPFVCERANVFVCFRG